ncbi:hypothetical protein EJB05_05449, partial [Eragrostis curvula]
NQKCSNSCGTSTALSQRCSAAGGGTTGGGDDRSSAKLRPLKKACAFTSAAPRLDPSRVRGSLSRSREMRSRAAASPAAEAGNSSGRRTMLRSVDSLVSPTNGRKTPYAHQSTAAPWPPPRATSGATYSCVPTKELDRASTGSATNRGCGGDARRFHLFSRRSCSSGMGRHVGAGTAASAASPLPFLSSAGDAVDSSDRSKSVSMMCPSARMSTFSGLRSRYTMPIMCRYSSARSTSAA